MYEINNFVYVSVDIMDDNKLMLDWLHAVCNIFYVKYSVCLKAIFVLHPSYSLRLHLWSKVPNYVKG